MASAIYLKNSYLLYLHKKLILCNNPMKKIDVNKAVWYNLKIEVYNRFDKIKKNTLYLYTNFTEVTLLA